MHIIYACCCLVASAVSDSVQPCGLQPAKLLSTGNSLGKNTGVGLYIYHIFLSIHSLMRT